MKILMVSTFESGGATIAARRQAEALRGKGIECSLVCIKENSQRDDIHITRDGYQILINVPASNWSYLGRLTSAYCRNNRSDVSNTWFSFWPNETSFDDHLLQVCVEFDVIHFHWIAQMVSTNFINKLVKLDKRVAFTGHDMNHFTGSCHYSAGCRNFEEGCDACPHLLSDPLKFVEESYQLKKAAFSELNAAWLFPSQWLLNEFVLSKFSKNTGAIKLQRNCLDTDKFTYLPETTREKKRQELGFYENDLVFIAGAADNTEKRKGFEYLDSGIQQLSAHLKKRNQEERRLVIVTFGHGAPIITTGSPHIRHQHLGIVDENQMVALLQYSDLMIFPSTEENFSNLILESLMCGCPVLGFSVGGVPDIVEPNINGNLVSTIDHTLFGDAMIAMANMDIIRALRNTTQTWRDAHAEFYSYDHIADKLKDVYHQIMPISMASRDKETGLTPPSSISLPSLSSVGQNEVHMQCALVENIGRYIKESRRDESHKYLGNVKLEAIFNGISEVVSTDDVGRAAWLLVDNSVLFHVNDLSRPALCLQIANIDWVVNLVDKVLPNLQASINSINSKIQVSTRENGGKFIYLWVLPDRASLVLDKINCLKLTFENPAISYEQDSRGFGILFSQITLFDLTFWKSSNRDSLAPDYATSNALNLKVSQTEFLWDGWNMKTNEMAYLPHVVSMWSEVMSASAQQVEANG